MLSEIRPNGTSIDPGELILRADGSLYHIGIRPGDIAEKVIIVGDPDRVPMISSKFDDCEFKISNREFVTHTGRIGDKKITVISSGIGVDNMDILINELDAAVNIDLPSRCIKDELVALELIRIGTCGSLQPDIGPGSFIASEYAFGLDRMPMHYRLQMTKKESDLYDSIANQIALFDGPESCYVSECSPKLLEKFLSERVIAGITATANGFYGPQGRQLRLAARFDMVEKYSSFRFEKLRILNFEMECSGFYALASGLGHEALTICTVLADRQGKEFHKSPSESVESLIDLVLARF